MAKILLQTGLARNQKTGCILFGKKNKVTGQDSMRELGILRKEIDPAGIVLR